MIKFSGFRFQVSEFSFQVSEFSFRFSGFRFRLFSYSIIQLLFFSACDREDAWDIFKTRGDSAVEYLTFPAFNGITVDNGINVVLANGDTYAATVNGWKNLMPKIKFSVDEEGKLLIEDKNSFNFVRTRDNRTTVYLTFAGELNFMELNGDGSIISNDTVFTSGLTVLCIDASGSVDLTVKTQGLYIGTNHNNVASVTVGGLANYVGITNWGYNPVNLFDLVSFYADIHQHGTGNTYINASESLSVVLYGFGNVYYKGNPSITLNRMGNGNLFGAD